MNQLNNQSWINSQDQLDDSLPYLAFLAYWNGKFSSSLVSLLNRLLSKQPKRNKPREGHGWLIFWSNAVSTSSSAPKCRRVFFTAQRDPICSCSQFLLAGVWSASSKSSHGLATPFLSLSNISRAQHKIGQIFASLWPCPVAPPASTFILWRFSSWMWGSTGGFDWSRVWKLARRWSHFNKPSLSVIPDPSRTSSARTITKFRRCS